MLTPFAGSQMHFLLIGFLLEDYIGRELLFCFFYYYFF